MANQRACMAVRRAIRDGELPKINTQKCVDCGRQAQHYDHRDYDKPLDVVPTCVSCNYKRGPAKGLHTGKGDDCYNFTEFQTIDTDDDVLQAINLISQVIDSAFLSKKEEVRVFDYMVDKLSEMSNGKEIKV